MYAQGPAKEDGPEITESRFHKLEITSCEELVQYIDIPEFGISERLPRSTFRLNSPESATIYISRESTSSDTLLYYLSEPLAAYLGVPNASSDIRTILTAPDEFLTELCTTCLKIPDLPDSWKDKLDHHSSLKELVSALSPSPTKSRSVRKQEIESALHPSEFRPAEPQISHKEIHSLMERIDHFIKNEAVSPVPVASERPESPRLSPQKRHARSRGKYMKLPLTNGPDERLEVNLPLSLRRQSEQPYKAMPAPWKKPDRSPLITRHKRFQHIESTYEETNFAAGFGGEYFVIQGICYAY